MPLQVGRHPNIVQLLEVFPTEHHLAIVMEFAAGGDLSELIDARGSQDVSGLCHVLHPSKAVLGRPANGHALCMPGAAAVPLAVALASDI